MSQIHKQKSSERPCAQGIKLLKAEIKTMPTTPGVYRMLGSEKEVLYVGKAKNLKKRIASYTRFAALPTRLKRMIASTKALEIVSTQTEAEALLLESQFIKRMKPKYNIVLRDDKSFAYISLRTSHPWPQIIKHRGVQKHDDEYFGPFASGAAIASTLKTIQKIFLLRSCSDTMLDSRTRPCLLYQIKRCSAPCVGKIKHADYVTLVKEASRFLRGKNTSIQKKLASEMERASDKRDYESAVVFRDRLSALSEIQSHQSVHVHHINDADIIALVKKAGQTCIQVFFFRNGQNWGNRSYFPTHSPEESPEMILSAFVAQFYADKKPPALILVNLNPDVRNLLETALSEKAEKNIKIIRPIKGARKSLVVEAEKNASLSLDRRLAERASEDKILRSVVALFSLKNKIKRIEVYDNSHLSGTNAVGAMIVAGPQGFQKNSYRKFNFRNTKSAPGDDYAMMREVFTRRFGRLMREDPDLIREQYPDLVVIDGGEGHLAAASDILDALKVKKVKLLAMAKGADRNNGHEMFYTQGQAPFTLPPSSPVLYYLQRLRDEAHRFAIFAHRMRRKRSFTHSPLDEIPQIGPKRKRALLNHFGSATAIAKAGTNDLALVSGISDAIAKTIYFHFHS